MKLFKTVTPVVIATLLVFGLVFLLPHSALAATSVVDGANAARGSGQPADLFGNLGVVTKITNILLFIVGALSVVMLIFGGLRYVISGGNSTAVTAAKNTVLYAIVGLVISLLAFAAINFVLNAFIPGMASGGTNV